ncbi:tail fiber assembly protein [Yersinia mollaretii]|uniref:tail fiber assembly protein n=1 Tax=Yersinia mollaretii TaxID=33060 RepID=UPI0005E81FE3|nr:tail fiber assembly protein [Yersinia mollaretii]PJE87633.1 tail fiber assembly protein [Yersinia mollaretii]CQD39664.1 tail fiber assembly protein G [Yersinia mollaretii]CQH10449.1 tail fiber assembly protein G [Yersinia mollaretii]
MSNYALVDKSGLVVNMVVWDGKTQWTPPEGLTPIEAEVAGIGWAYIDGKFIQPPDPALPHEEYVAQAENNKSGLMNLAVRKISLWHAKLTLEMISDGDKQKLIAWVDYMDLLDAVDASLAPNIEWPVTPDESTT